MHTDRCPSNSTATATAVTDAQTGLDSASSGIKTIAASLLTGQTAPADARDQVKNGLLAAQTALNGITTQVVSLRSSSTFLPTICPQRRHRNYGGPKQAQ